MVLGIAGIGSARVDGVPWVDGRRVEEAGIGSCFGKIFVVVGLVKGHCSVSFLAVVRGGGVLFIELCLIVVIILFRFGFRLGFVVVVAAVVVCVHGIGLVVAVVFLPRVSGIFLLREMLGGFDGRDTDRRGRGVHHWHDVVRGMLCL